jgi:rhodanese-related sulfurtransferase
MATRQFRPSSSFFSLLCIGLLFACTSSNGQNNLEAVTFSKELAQKEHPQLLDVRTPEEFQSGHLKDAVNFNVLASDFQSQVSKLDKSQPVFVYCKVGGRSADAVENA